MEMTEYIIFGICMIGIAYTSYNIGFKEGISMGAGLMWEKLWDMGKPRKRDPRIRAVELSKDNAGQYNKKFIKNIKLETNSNSYNYDNCMDSCRRYNNSIEHWCSRCYN